LGSVHARGFVAQWFYGFRDSAESLQCKLKCLAAGKSDCRIRGHFDQQPTDRSAFPDAMDQVENVRPGFVGGVGLEAETCRADQERQYLTRWIGTHDRIGVGVEVLVEGLRLVGEAGEGVEAVEAADGRVVPAGPQVLPAGGVGRLAAVAMIGGSA